jgi:HAD superfamily hydrolase (TIGR01509 family)
MKIKAVIFDLDGTITEPYFDFDIIRAEIGLAPDAGPLLEAIEKITNTQQRKKAEEILYKHEQLAIEHSILNKGAASTLRKLRRMGIHIGILTRNTRSNASAVAKKHNIKFDAVVDRNDGPVKPDPFGVKKLCEFFKVEPARTLVVGDYLFDLQSAKAAGATAVLIKTGENAARFGHMADYIIDRLEEIIGIIVASS